MKVIISLTAILAVSTACVPEPASRGKQKETTQSAEQLEDTSTAKNKKAKDEEEGNFALTEDAQAEAVVEALEEVAANGEEEIADSEANDGQSILEMLRQRDRTCVEEDGVVTVNVTRKKNASAEGDLRLASVERSYEMTRKFSGIDVHCNDRGTFARLPLSLVALDGLVIETEGKRHVARAYDRKDDEQAGKSMDILTEGTRRSELAVEDSGTSVTIRHTREVRLSQTAEFKAAETKNFERSLETIEGSPIVTVRTWEKGRPRNNSFAIESGALAVRRASGELVKLKFDNVKIERQGLGLCRRDRSGVVSGEIFANANDAEPQRTFTVDFSGAGVVIKFSDGTERSIKPAICS